jgi:hypothetical protein
MKLTGLLVLLAAATSTFASPRPTPKNCDVKTMQAHIGHGHKSIIQAICSNSAEADTKDGGAKGPKVAKGSKTTTYRRKYSLFLHWFLMILTTVTRLNRGI